MSDGFDPYHKWLGIPPSEQPPHHYRLLGVPLFETDPDVITHAADRQMAHVRTFQAGPHSVESQMLLNELATAKLCLLKLERRAEYDGRLRAQLEPQSSTEPLASVVSLPEPTPQFATQPVVHSVRPIEQVLMKPLAQRGLDKTSRTGVSIANLRWKVPALLGGVCAAVILLVWFLRAQSSRRLDAEFAKPLGQSQIARKVEAVSTRVELPAAPFSPTAPTGSGSPKPVPVAAPISLSQEPPPLEPGGTYALRLSHREYVELSDTRGLADLNQPFTVEVWARVDTSQDAPAIMGNFHQIRDSTGSYLQSGWLYYFTRFPGQDFGKYSGAIRFKADGTALVGRATVPQRLGEGWHHLCICREENQVTLFVDGVRPLKITVDGKNFRGSPGNLCLGRPSEATVRDSAGCDILAFRLSGVTRYTGEFAPPWSLERDAHTLVLLDFSLGRGDELPDLSGNRHHGKMMGGKWIAVSPRELAPAEGIVTASKDSTSTARPQPLPAGSPDVPSEDVTTASVGGKYTELLKVFASPLDEQSYGKFREYGHWGGSSWREHKNLPAGYWVYVAPNWYIWKNLANVAVKPSKVVPQSPPPSPAVDQPPLVVKISASDESARQPKSPMPEAPAQRLVQARVRDMFKTEYARATNPAESRLLAETFLKQAREISNDPPLQYTLFDEARRLAAETDEWPLVLVVIDDFESRFEIDASLLKLESLQKFFERAQTSAGRRNLATAAMAEIDKAAERAQFDFALKLANLAQSESRDIKVSKQLVARIADLQKLQSERDAVQAAMKTLRDQPDDATALGVYGKYLCLTKGFWDTGLPMLALTSDARLAAAAKRDLANPKSPMVRSQVADAWSGLAATEPEPAKSQLQARAGRWYQMALAEAPPLVKMKVEKQLEALGLQHDALPELAPPALAGLTPAAVKESLRPSFVHADLGEGTVILLRRIEPGTFLMGSPPIKTARYVPETQHQVTLTKPFYLGTTEVTQAQWRRVMGSNPSAHTGDDRLPVERVTWSQCCSFCEKLTQASAAAPYNVHFRLPTEAEWEYACRAGSTADYSFGSDASRMPQFGWFSGNSADKSHPVGQLLPNVWGLYDMHGNVQEFCQDAYEKDYFTAAPAVDPLCATGKYNISRGGNWSTAAYPARCSARSYEASPQYLGLRVACDVRWPD